MRAGTAGANTLARVFSWSGALLFAVSLIYFLYAYLTRFGTAAAGGDRRAAITWNVTVFTAFALHHSVFARLPVRRWVERRLSPELERPFYVWIASLLFLIVCATWKPVPGVAWHAEGLILWLLRALQAAGLALTAWSAGVLDVRVLSGVSGPPGRAAPAAAQPVQSAGPVFKTTGPYGWLRHPIYAGWFLMVLPASPMTMTRLIFAAVSCVYLVIAIPVEERTMRATSNGAYDRYKARVRWRLLPGLY